MHDDRPPTASASGGDQPRLRYAEIMIRLGKGLCAPLPSGKPSPVREFIGQSLLAWGQTIDPQEEARWDRTDRGMTAALVLLAVALACSTEPQVQPA